MKRTPFLLTVCLLAACARPHPATPEPQLLLTPTWLVKNSCAPDVPNFAPVVFSATHIAGLPVTYSQIGPDGDTTSTVAHSFDGECELYTGITIGRPTTVPATGVLGQTRICGSDRCEWMVAGTWE
jgi:hypothetical protein